MTFVHSPFARPHRRTGPLRAAALAFATAVALSLSACGGGTHGGDDDETVGMPADLPATTLPADDAIVARASLGRLVSAPASADNQAVFDRISRYFSSRVAFSDAASLRAGDVLLIDGTQVTPDDLRGSDRLAATAMAAQVPILIVGFDDALEEAIHQLLPTASVPGYSSVALIEPPRPGQPWSDGSITVSQAVGNAVTRLPATRNTTDQLVARVATFHARRSVSAADASAVQRDGGSNAQCTGDDPADCARIQKQPLARLSIVEDFSFNGLRRETRCLMRDWVPFDVIEGSFGDRQVYTGYADGNQPVYATPQCPSQVWDFYPTLYLNDPVNGKPSRYLQINVNGSFNPNVADNGNDLLGWYQTRRQLTLTPTSGQTPWHHIANAPTTSNNQTTVSDTRGWSLNLGGEAGSAGSKGGVGASVNFSHTTSNVIPDWKLIDQTDATAGVWKFDFQQAQPYAVNEGSGSACASVARAMFRWLGVPCASLPTHVQNDRVKDLSLYTGTLEGLIVWDLEPRNNNQGRATIEVVSSSWFDATGCSRMTKKSHREYPTPPQYLKNANCVANQLRSNDGTWSSRVQRQTSQTLSIDLAALPVPVR